MKSKYIQVLLVQSCCLCMSIIFLTLHANAFATEPYKVGAGDLLSIVVFGEPDLSMNKARVTAEGVVPFPLLGRINVKGFTAKKIEQELTLLLLDGYLKKPQVTVSILEYRFYYVTGQVRKPNGYHYVEGLTVQKAIALAGGFTVRGSESKMTLIKENTPKRVYRVTKNTPMKPGDLLNVGESLF